MGAALKTSKAIAGSKGGAATEKQPSIASNSVPSLATARMVYLWSWGPIAGPVDGLKSVKLDGTQVMADDGTLNYPGVKWQFRNGELNQQRLEGIAEASNEIAVNHQLLSVSPWIYSANNPAIDALRVRFGWPQLQSQDSSGNINGVLIEYAIDVATDGGPYTTVLTSSVDRKNVTKYERSHRVDLPAGSRWSLRVRRLTPEANNSLVQDGMLIEAIAEVVDSDQEYPLTAVSALEYDAQQFGGDIAKVAVLMRGRIVRVPANYDAESRTYSAGGPGTSNGIWDGTFKEAYTNNPAWVFYDLVLHPYYGLGERIDATMIDRWSLYRIAQYCDQMVSNGSGGLEPRFTCNLYLQKQAEAYAVLQDLASIFHGLSFWDGSQIVVNADMPGDPVYTYSPSQILNDGAIQYEGTRARDRHTLAMVSWDNPAIGYDTDKEPIFDEEAMAEFGSVRDIPVAAFACTSQGQAQRAGLWALMTEQLQTRGAKFAVGLDGQIPRPGQVIAVADPMFAGRDNGGRISAVAGRVITLDREVTLPAGARLFCNLPSGKSEARAVRSVSGRAVTVMADYSEVPEPESGWAIDYDDLKLMQFYVRNITRPQWHQFQFELIQHEPSKFGAIDSGSVIDTRPISVLPVGTQEAPARVLISQHVVIDQGIAITVMTIAWDSALNAVSYDVEWRWGAREWVKVPRTGELSVDVRGIYSGQYMARVRAVSAMNVSSIPTTSALTDLEGKTGAPPSVTSLTTESLLFGIKITWAFPPGAEDTQRTEIWYGPANDLAAATKLADLAYPQSDYSMQKLQAGATLFFWARLVDRSGNIGPFYPVVDGVVGQSSHDATPILDQIAGQVTESQLGQELLADIKKIELIDGNGPGSVNERLGEVKTVLEGQVGAVNDAVTVVKGDLVTQVAQINTSVTTVKNNLQGQIDTISVAANALTYAPTKTYAAGLTVNVNGRLYQSTQAVPVSTPPPNTTYWLDIGSVVSSANGLAARVTTNETKITAIEGVNTAQSSTITGLQSALTGKADATAVNSLTTRVTTAEGSITSQGQAITGLTNTVAGKADASALNSLTTRVTSAEGVNTSQGTAITNLTNTVTGKADASAVQALTTRVTATEGKNADQDASITSQGQAITTLGNSVAGKADASAVQALTSRVTAAEGVNTSQASQITNLTTTVNGKADSSTVSALTNTVTQQGADITAQGQALTNVTASIGNVGGENLLYNSSFEKLQDGSTATPDGWAFSIPGGTPWSSVPVASTLDPAGVAQRINVADLTASTYVDMTPIVAKRPSLSAGQVVTLSVYVRGTAGLGFQLFMQHRNAAGTVTATASQGVAVLADGWQRIVLTSAPLPAGTINTAPLLRVRPNIGATITSGFVELDRAQLEISGTVSGWSDNNGTTDAAVTAGATATTALTARVIQTETGLTSASGQLTQLTNSIGLLSDNMLPNSSFEQVSVTGWPRYWRSAGSASPVTTFVDSSLASSQKAVRLTRDAMPNGSYIDLQLYTAEASDPAVVAGQTYTLSVYARLSSPSARLAMYIQWVNAAGSVINTAQLPETAVGTAFTRMSFSAAAPTGAVAAHIYAGRLLNRSGAAADMWIELDNVQFQTGATATTYSPLTVAGVAAELAATSSAVQTLTSTVTQQGAALTSQSGSITALENTVNSTTDGLATKATAAALNALTTRVTSSEGVNTSQSSSIVDLNNSITTIQGALGVSGLDPADGAIWNFDTAVEGWTSANSTLSIPTPGVLRQTSTNGDPSIQRAGLSIDGSLYTKIRASITRRAGTVATDWDGQLFYATSGHGVTSSFRKTVPNPNLAVGSSAVIEWDMAALTAGGTDWTTSTITAIRLDIGLSNAGVFDIDWIAVGRVAPGASSRALSSLTSTVTAQGANLTAQTTRIDGLYTSVGSANSAIQTEATTRANADSAQATLITNLQSASTATNAAIQSEATTRANADSALSTRVDGVQATAGTASANAQQALTASANTNGEINASYSVKLMTMDNGTKVAAGFGLGLGNESGVTQSTFAVSADRFVVLNSSLSGSLTSPFAVVGGQVFINDAMINKATITNALIGQSINSSTLTSYGLPVMSTDYAAGQISIRNKATDGKYLQLSEQGLFMVSGGVAILELRF